MSEQPASKRSFAPRTEQQRKDMRAELLSLVLDMSVDPKQRGEDATRVVSRSLQATLDGDTILLMRAAAMVAVQDVMSEVRILAGRQTVANSGGSTPTSPRATRTTW